MLPIRYIVYAHGYLDNDDGCVIDGVWNDSAKMTFRLLWDFLTQYDSVNPERLIRIGFFSKLDDTWCHKINGEYHEGYCKVVDISRMNQLPKEFYKPIPLVSELIDNTHPDTPFNACLSLNTETFDDDTIGNYHGKNPYVIICDNNDNPGKYTRISFTKLQCACPCVPMLSIVQSLFDYHTDTYGEYQELEIYFSGCRKSNTPKPPSCSISPKRECSVRFNPGTETAGGKRKRTQKRKRIKKRKTRRSSRIR